MIEKMERITLFGLTGDSKSVISALMDCGCVQVTDPEDARDYEELSKQLSRNTVEMYESEQLSSRVGTALKALAPYSTKRGLFEWKPTVEKKELSDAALSEQAKAVCGKVEELQKEIAFLKAEISREELLRVSLEPWRELDQPLEFSETKTCEFFLMSVPAEVSTETLAEQAAEQGLRTYLSQISEDADLRYLAASAVKADVAAVQELIRQAGGSRIAFPGLEGTAAANISASAKRGEELTARLEQAQESLKGCASETPLLQKASDSIDIVLESERARQKMLHTQNAFVLQAWVPVRAKARVDKALEQFSCYYEYTQPEDGEEPPVLLKNNAFAEPFESVTSMYSLPNYYGFDPDAIMAPFFFIFFGMMLSDAGYGLILAIAGFFAAAKMDLGPGAKKMMKMIGYCGISTVIWGALYGSWFGDAIPQVAEVFFGKTITIPAVFDPLGDPMTILIMSFAFGFVHLVVGMGISAYMMIKRGHPWQALFDIGFWYFILFGLLIFALGSMVFGSQLVTNIGMYLAIAGAIGIVLTAGRDKKNPIMKFFGGLLGLYDITGYFSDILSYSRIMALGLATGVVASVMNTIGTLPGKSIVGVIVFILVFIIGHVVNLAINALGSYVHTSRLHYVEFFGKFFEGGGEPFRPLQAKTKYVHIKKQEEI